MTLNASSTPQLTPSLFNTRQANRRRSGHNRLFLATVDSTQRKPMLYTVLHAPAPALNTLTRTDTTFRRVPIRTQARVRIRFRMLSHLPHVHF
jgi:peptide subunit release factor 1 (eRF1)